MTEVWSADTGEFVEPPGQEQRAAAIRQLLRDAQDEPASSEVVAERRRARLRWSELDPSAIDISHV